MPKGYHDNPKSHAINSYGAFHSKNVPLSTKLELSKIPTYTSFNAVQTSGSIKEALEDTKNKIDQYFEELIKTISEYFKMTKNKIFRSKLMFSLEERHLQVLKKQYPKVEYNPETREVTIYNTNQSLTPSGEPEGKQEEELKKPPLPQPYYATTEAWKGRPINMETYKQVINLLMQNGAVKFDKGETLTLHQLTTLKLIFGKDNLVIAEKDGQVIIALKNPKKVKKYLKSKGKPILAYVLSKNELPDYVAELVKWDELLLGNSPDSKELRATWVQQFKEYHEYLEKKKQLEAQKTAKEIEQIIEEKHAEPEVKPPEIEKKPEEKKERKEIKPEIKQETKSEEKEENILEDVTDKVKDIVSQTTEVIGEAIEKAKETVEEVIPKKEEKPEPEKKPKVVKPPKSAVSRKRKSAISKVKPPKTGAIKFASIRVNNRDIEFIAEDIYDIDMKDMDRKKAELFGFIIPQKIKQKMIGNSNVSVYYFTPEQAKIMEIAGWKVYDEMKVGKRKRLLGMIMPSPSEIPKNVKFDMKVSVRRKTPYIYIEKITLPTTLYVKDTMGNVVELKPNTTYKVKFVKSNLLLIPENERWSGNYKHLYIIPKELFTFIIPERMKRY